jgi:hypothetical protein
MKWQTATSYEDVLKAKRIEKFAEQTHFKITPKISLTKRNLLKH